MQLYKLNRFEIKSCLETQIVRISAQHVTHFSNMFQFNLIKLILEKSGTDKNLNAK